LKRKHERNTLRCDIAPLTPPWSRQKRVLRMKYGYTCKCGWRLERLGRRGYALTRREYATKKEVHAETCEALRKELEQSRKATATQ